LYWTISSSATWVGGSGERAIASWKDGGDSESRMGGLMTIAMPADVSEHVDRSLVDESLCAEVEDDDEGGDGDGGGVIFSDGVRGHRGTSLSSDLKSLTGDLALETAIEGQ
jgi:hypothetical protein